MFFDHLEMRIGHDFCNHVMAKEQPEALSHGTATSYMQSTLHTQEKSSGMHTVQPQHNLEKH